MKRLTIVLIPLCFLLLQGCAANSMRGFMRNSHEPVEFHVKRGFAADIFECPATISVILPDGEQFEGKLIAASVGYFDVPCGCRIIYTGEVKTLMAGSRGRRIKCRFPGKEFPLTGTTGICEVSDGNFIDVMWIGRKGKEKWDGKKIEVRGRNNIKVLEDGRIMFVPTGLILDGTATYYPYTEDIDGHSTGKARKGNYWKIELKD